MSLAITRSAYACRRALATVLAFAGCQRDRVLPTVPLDQLGDQRTTTVNVAPMALFTVSPRWPRPGDTVTVDASFSIDRDGSVVAYEWSLGNGTTQITGARARTVFARAGSYPLSVTVVDDSGSRSTRTLNLTIAASGPPATAVDSTQSLVVAASTSWLAAATTLVTVTARTVQGLPVPNVPVWLSGTGRDWRAVQPSALTTAAGVATGTVSSPITQSAQLLAIADYTLLRSVPVTIGATNLSLSGSTLRLTDPTVTSAADSTLVEVTARDTVGNPLIGALVTVSVAGGTATVRNEGPTDGNGRRVVTVVPTACGGVPLSVTASVNGTVLPTTATFTASAPAAYSVCGAALWFDADAPGTIIQSGDVLTAWHDLSGAARHSTTTAGPLVVTAGFNGRTALRFNGSSHFVPMADVASGAPYTAFVIERRRSSRSSNFVLGGTTTSSRNNLLLGYSTTDALRLSHYEANLDASVAAFTTLAAEPGRVLGARWTSGARSLQVNNATVATDATTGSVLSWSGAAVGRLNLAGTMVFYDGDVGEVLLFRRALSDAERTTVNRALMAKWSLGTLTAVAGDGQTGTVGGTLPVAPRVRVTDDNSTPLTGATVSWQILTGAGTLSTLITTTDANGDAFVTWTLGASGTNSIRAQFGARSVDFTATAGGTCIGSTSVCDAALWVDASDASTITTSSGLVTEWRDKSGWSRHLTATATSAPRVEPNPLVLRNMLRFDGTDFLTLTNRALNGTGAYTILVVERRRSVDPGAILGRGAASGAPTPILGYASSSTAFVSHGSSPLVGTVSAFTTATAHPTRVWAMRYMNGTRSLSINNAVIATDNAVGNITMNSGATIGRHEASWYNGDLGEIVLLPRAATNAELEALTLFLMGKWGAGTLAIDAGNAQSADAGTSPSVAPRVRLTDGNGNGIPNVIVAWQVTGGGGRVYGLSSYNAMTSASGHASIPSGNWILDNGANELTVWQSASIGQGPSLTMTGNGLLPGTPTLHLDAQHGASFTLNGSAITTWRDRAGSSRTVEQSMSSLRPTYSASGINGRPAVVFDGANDVLVGNSVSYGISGARSLFVVLRTTGSVVSGTCTDGAGQYLVDRNTANLGGNPLTSVKAVGGRWVVQSRTDNGNSLGCAPILGGITITTNATTLVGAVQTTSTLTVYGNGLWTGTLPISGTNTMQPIALGRHGDQSASPTLPGAIGEVLVFPSALSTTDRLIVERYLGWKWGVTVP